MKKTLLLNASYEVLRFITDKKALKLLFKEDKVEVISNWEDNITWGSGIIKHPSILRLKNQIKRNFNNFGFSRKAVVKRDDSTCQYCSKKLSAAQVTIDHIVPKVNGGLTSFINCVVSCHTCNNFKADKNLEQVNMKLLKRPINPSFSSKMHLLEPQEFWHNDWSTFLHSI